jgi:hypothetical protein
MDFADTGGIDFGSFLGGLIEESSRRRTEDKSFELQMAQINAGARTVTDTAQKPQIFGLAPETVIVGAGVLVGVALLFLALK